MTFTNSDYIAASSAIVALCALFVSVFQAWATLRHNRLQTRPLIDHLTCTTASESTLTLENHGLGPAILSSISATHNGSVFELTRPADVQALLQRIPQAAKAARVELFQLTNGSALHAGRTQHILEGFTDDPAVRRALNHFLDSIDIKVTYACLYGKRHVSE